MICDQFPIAFSPLELGDSVIFGVCIFSLQKSKGSEAGPQGDGIPNVPPDLIVLRDEDQECEHQHGHEQDLEHVVIPRKKAKVATNKRMLEEHLINVSVYY